MRTPRFYATAPTSAALMPEVTPRHAGPGSRTTARSSSSAGAMTGQGGDRSIPSPSLLIELPGVARAFSAAWRMRRSSCR